MRGFMIGALLASMLTTPVPPRAAATPAPTRTSVFFQVHNTNRSALACNSDGRAYEIRGDLVTPHGPVPARVTLALHEFSFGRFFWSFTDAPSYDFAARMAQAGHAWVVIDRLGYDASGHPAGNATCLGAQADVTAQIVRALRTGTYRTNRATAPRFKEVLLAGHSVGGGIAELTAHSFADLNLAGLILFAWADQSYSSRTIRQSLDQGADCARGGEPAEAGGPVGYAFFGRTERDFQANMFFDGDWSVIQAATRKRNRDPCGDNATLARLAVVNRLGVARLRFPVLLVFGDEDPAFQEGAAEQQAGLFSASTAVTVHHVPRAAHALTLERAAPVTHAHVLGWLRSLQPRTTAS